VTERIRILIVDDEVAIRRFLRASLDPALYELLEAEDGEHAIRTTATENPKIVLLDLGLPDLDGIEVAKRIREWSDVPIVVLSARGQEADKVAALDAGADDYLTKPFGINELMARIRVALRHRPKSEPEDPIFEAKGVRVDLATRRVFRNGDEVHLTPTEYKLLALLIRHAGRVVTHRQMLLEVWGPAYAQESHYLRVYMGQLRHKLEPNPAQPQLLTNEPGVGYRMRVDP
jgi:two-component system, OmpR family, KDP operon response regulator KdpE